MGNAGLSNVIKGWISELTLNRYVLCLDFGSRLFYLPHPWSCALVVA